jgi:hypothetical protein
MRSNLALALCQLQLFQREIRMSYKLVMAIAVASVFAVPASTFAQSDEQETKKPEQSQLILSQSDEKETTKPEQSQPTISQSDEKEPKKPELVS